jgi:hypothetical protein
VGEDQVEIENVNKPTPGDDTGCPDWGCGSNSPEIDSLGFHDLNVVGLPNLQGYFIYGFRKQDTAGTWVQYSPYVSNAQLYARHANGTILSGTQLSGSVFEIRNAVTGLLYELRVGDTSLLNYWVEPASGPVATYTYVLDWRPLDQGQFRGLCKNPNSSLPEDGLDGFKAVLFEDDRINADDIRVNRPEANWFNLGCGGHALSKLHLGGHTKAASAMLGIPTTLAHRTAYLKMLSADYCGSGDPFTVAGQPLRYRVENNGVDTTDAIAPGLTPLEARWTENGATCLQTPRVAYGVQTPEAVMQFGTPMEVEGYIAATCRRPPPCTNPTVAVLDGKHVLSANPP